MNNENLNFGWEAMNDEELFNQAQLDEQEFIEEDEQRDDE